MPHVRPRLTLFGILAMTGLVGCAAPRPPPRVSISSGDYPAAFEHAKQVLREFEFELDRVDARRGVITTAPRAWSGAATPWLPFASTARDPLEGLLQFEQRIVRVEFTPAGASSTDVRADLVDTDRDFIADVRVSVERVQRPGRRVDATSVRLVSIERDPHSPAAAGGAIVVEHRQDDALASRLAERWRALQALPPPSDP
jgi:hypothetical protein